MAKVRVKHINPILKFFSQDRTYKYFNGDDIMPINIEFSPSGVCNASCRKCFYRVNNRELKGHDSIYFDFELFKRLIKELKNCGVKSITWTGGGEPTMHPNFLEITKLVKRYGLEQGLFTNALGKITYDPSVFEWIRVTRTNKPFPIDNILHLLSCKTVGLCINYAKGDDDILAEGINLIELLDKTKTSKDYSVYLQIRPEMNNLGALHDNELPVINHPLVEITSKVSYSFSERGYDKCEAFHFTPFIWQDGIVSICAYHKGNKEFELGDITKESFSDIMKNAPRYVDVIPTCMACCKLHEMNKYIEERKNLTDINFI